MKAATKPGQRKPITEGLISSPKNLNQNTGLFHFTGVELTPFAKP